MAAVPEPGGRPAAAGPPRDPGSGGWPEPTEPEPAEPADTDTFAAGSSASKTPASRPLRIVVAPDSFKGSLTSVEVADAISMGWRAARPGDIVDVVPLADGGAGTIDALLAAGGWQARTVTVHDPLGRPVEARWLAADDGRRAFVEMAEASGLARVPLAERPAAAVHASTRGTGELLCAVLDAGIRDVVLGVGGSATTDGGAGALAALGARIETADGARMGTGNELLPRPGGGALAGVARVDLAGLDLRLAGMRLRIACDVSNPLLGPAGAAAVYGPQKGASPEDVERLDSALARWADALAAASASAAGLDARGVPQDGVADRDPRDVPGAGADGAGPGLDPRDVPQAGAAGRVDPRDVPGAGAAGGTTFAFLAVAGRLGSVTLVPGVELVAAEVDLDGRVRAADLVITGEGRIDAQTAFGKTCLGVARIARDAGVPCVALGGSVEQGGATALAAVGAVAQPVHPIPIAVAEAMAAGAAPVRAAAERIARSVTTLGLASMGDRR